MRWGRHTKTLRSDVQRGSTPFGLIAAYAVVAATLMACDAGHGRREPTESHRGNAPEVTIVGAPTALSLATTDPKVTVSCATCHAAGRTFTSPTAPASGAVHANIKLAHGTVQCFACHDRQDRTQLHRADASLLGAEQTMVLCGQCHGPQQRDYDHGSHGGMTGYWDGTRGGQTRNHCVLCHDPHAPAIARVTPMPGPADATQSHRDHR